MDSCLNFFSPKEEHKMLRSLTKNFAEKRLMPTAQERDKNEYFDLNLFKEIGQLGLLGICAEEKYGGSNMDAISAVIVHEELSFADPGFCLAYLAHAILCVNNISKNAHEKQKEKYLPKLISGEWLGAMAMSEPGAGTDVLGMKAKALKNDLGYLLNGRKMWITNGAKDENKTPADVVFVYAKTDEQKNSISSFIVEGGQKGFFVGQKLKDKLGMRASLTAELVFDNCQLEHNQIVGNEGESLIHMMKNLEIERLTLAAMAVGIAKRCLDIMNKYAQERFAFGKSINSFGQIKKYIADSFAEYKAVRAYLYLTAHNLSLTSGNNRVDSDAVKLLASTVAKRIADNAIQVLGGYGYMADYVVERLWRDAKLLEIGGGTLEAHQKNIASDLAKRSSIIND